MIRILKFAKKSLQWLFSKTYKVLESRESACRSRFTASTNDNHYNEYGKNILRRIAPRFEFFKKRSAVKANLEKCHFMTALAQERVEMK